MTVEPIACDFNAIPAEERDAHRALSDALFARASGIEELEAGMALRFPPDDETLAQLSEYIRNERRCCPFFTFNLRVEGRHAVRLEFTGTQEVKDYFKRSLETQGML